MNNSETKRPPYKKMNQCCLSTGFEADGEDSTYLDIAPTMLNITHGGFTYRRIADMWGWNNESKLTHAVYVRTDWMIRTKVRCGIISQADANCVPPPKKRTS